MSIYLDEGGVSISMWDFVNKCEILYQTRSPQKLSQKFQYWCSQCECAIEYGVIPTLTSICPQCGLLLDEFDWDEISGHNYEEYRDGYLNDYKESIDDGYDPDKMWDIE